VAAKFPELPRHLRAMRKGKIRLRSRAELVDAVDLIVEPDLLFDRQRINEVADRLTPIRGTVVDGAKTFRIASRRPRDDVTSFDRGCALYVIWYAQCL